MMINRRFGSFISKAVLKLNTYEINERRQCCQRIQNLNYKTKEVINHFQDSFRDNFVTPFEKVVFDKQGYKKVGKMIGKGDIEHFIKEGFSRVGCEQIHPLSCNQFCFNYFFTTWGNTYRTYGAVYLIQMLFRLKKMSKDPTRQIPKFIIAYLKSTSLTAVQMMIMRRVLCFLCRHYSNKQNNLILANFLSGLYLLIESKTRRAQIALYQLNNTTNIVYNIAVRRGFIKGMKYGECLLFAVSMMVISYYYYDCKDAFRKSYILTVFQYLTGQKY